MRSTLWTRAARPKLPGSTTQPQGRWRTSAIRQTRATPLRRPVTINDVFTLLLTPILATALLADTSWKDKRRKDWAAKIAEIETETEQIQSRTLQSWQTLQSRSLRLGAAEQRRHYSAAALLPALVEEVEGITDIRPPFLEDFEYEPEWFDGALQDGRNPIPTPNKAKYHSKEFSQDALEASERLRRLLGVKLALNLTIYVNTGVSPSKIRRAIRIPNFDDNFKFSDHDSQNLPTLLQSMKRICSTIETLNASLPIGAIPLSIEPTDVLTLQLQEDICSLSQRYEAGSILLPDLVSLYTLAVLRSSASPTSKAYRALFHGLARGSGGNPPCYDVAMQTLTAWEQSKLPIREHDLWVILTELANRKHVQKFDGLMRDLTTSPPFINVSGAWTWATARDIQVPVPESYHPAILTTLVHCALRFDQTEKAEAWSEILRRTWVNITDPSQKTPLQRFFTNWMRYCEVHGNWRKGVDWLDAAQKWITSIASFDMYSLQRMIVGMLSLCFACGKPKEYAEILEAAVSSGIPSLIPESFMSKSIRRAICAEWIVSYKVSYHKKLDLRTDEEKVRAFQQKIRLIVRTLAPPKNDADVEWRQTQVDKPNPLPPGLLKNSSEGASEEATNTWKRLYTENQEITRHAVKRFEDFRTLYHSQGRELEALKTELAYQKKLVRDLTNKNGVKKEETSSGANNVESQEPPLKAPNSIPNARLRYVTSRSGESEIAPEQVRFCSSTSILVPGKLDTAMESTAVNHPKNFSSGKSLSVEDPSRANWLDLRASPEDFDGAAAVAIAS